MSPAPLATGPKTAEGKATSSRNALTHGLTAASLLLPGENAEDFDALRQSLFDAHTPAPGLETALLDQIAQCLWRLNRARRIERDALEQDLTAPESQAGNRLDKILRYVAAIEREFHRAIRDLAKLQSARVQNTLAEKTAEAKSESARLDRELSVALGGPLPAAPRKTQNYETNTYPQPNPPASRAPAGSRVAAAART